MKLFRYKVYTPDINNVLEFVGTLEVSAQNQEDASKKAHDMLELDHYIMENPQINFEVLTVSDAIELNEGK